MSNVETVDYPPPVPGAVVDMLYAAHEELRNSEPLSDEENAQRKRWIGCKMRMSMWLQDMGLDRGEGYHPADPRYQPPTFVEGVGWVRP